MECRYSRDRAPSPQVRTATGTPTSTVVVRITSSCQGRLAAREDLVVAHRELALHEVVVILGIEHRDLRVGPGERSDGLDAGPGRHHAELDQVADVAAGELRGQVAGRLEVAGKAGAGDVVRVVVGPVGSGLAPPDAEDRSRRRRARFGHAPTVGDRADTIFSTR